METKITLTDATSPSIPLILITHHFNGPKLSFDEGNYHQWAASMRSCLQANHLWGHITGTTPRPGADEPLAQRNWDENDKAVAAFIANNVSAPEWKYAGELRSGARAYWRAIEEWHAGDDPLRQAMLFLQAMSFPCPLGTNLLGLLDQMQDLLTRAFSLGPVSEDTFHVVVFLFLLSRTRGFRSVREGIVRELMAGVPFGVADLRRRVVLEQFFFGGCHHATQVGNRGLVESSVLRQKSSVDGFQRAVPDLTLDDLIGPVETVMIPDSTSPTPKSNFNADSLRKAAMNSISSTPTLVSPIQITRPVTVSHCLPVKPTTMSAHTITQSLPERSRQQCTYCKRTNSISSTPTLVSPNQTAPPSRVTASHPLPPKATTIPSHPFTQSLPASPRQQCTNCQRLGHVKRYCISENGGMAGRSIAESKAQRWLDHQRSQKKVRVEGLDGEVYIVDRAILTRLPGSPAALSDEFFSVMSSVASTPSGASKARLGVCEGC